uniref:Protein Wnt n=1 Tax=Ditylenchus dipsaci TaxID=166011 RepID=A0A915DGC1_9BILA
MIKSIGRTTKSVVDIDSEQKFEIAYCSSEGADSTCAVDSTCATIYRWKRANIRQELYPSSGLEMMSNDEILVPKDVHVLSTPYNPARNPTCLLSSFE